MQKEQLPIGVFDSGVGGLTVVKEIRSQLPHEDVIYFGDTARVPYGEKSKETIIRYSIENSLFLMEKNIKMLVVACNTASSCAIDRLQRIFKIPVVGVIQPGIEAVISLTKNQKIAILGTKGTIRSGVYQDEIKRLLPKSEIFPIACPLLAPLVEEKLIDHPAAKLLVEEYLSPLKKQSIDTLLLACTHYPLLKRVIQSQIGESVNVIDSAGHCVKKMKEILTSHSLINSKATPAICKYFVSDDPKKFKEIGVEFLGDVIESVELSPSLFFSHL